MLRKFGVSAIHAKETAEKQGMPMTWCLLYCRLGLPCASQTHHTVHNLRVFGGNVFGVQANSWKHRGSLAGGCLCVSAPCLYLQNSPVPLDVGQCHFLQEASTDFPTLEGLLCSPCTVGMASALPYNEGHCSGLPVCQYTELS